MQSDKNCNQIKYTSLLFPNYTVDGKLRLGNNSTKRTNSEAKLKNNEHSLQ